MRILLLAMALCLSGCGSTLGDETPYDKPADEDGDGFAADVDCNDTDADIYPGHTEWCDRADNDCDGEVDEDITDGCGEDEDGDGFPSTDCNDDDPEINPSAVEVCDDAADNDCDGTTDEEIDSDGDGWLSCVGGDGKTGDCNDEVASRNPDAEEVCSAFDEDCDGENNEGLTCTGRP